MLAAAWSLLVLGAVAVLSIAAAPAPSHPAAASPSGEHASVPDVPNAGGGQSFTGQAASNEAMVTFEFREGFQSGYLKALPLFDAAGLATVHSVVPEYLGYLGYINVAQLTSLQKRGHEVVPRSTSFGKEFAITPDTSLVEIRDAVEEAVKEKQWLVIVIYRVEEPNTHDGKSAQLGAVKSAIREVERAGLRVVTHAEGEKILRLAE